MRGGPAGGGAHSRRTTQSDGSELRAAASAGPAGGPTLQPQGVCASESEVPRGVCVRKKSGVKEGVGAERTGCGAGVGGGSSLEVEGFEGGGRWEGGSQCRAALEPGPSLVTLRRDGGGDPLPPHHHHKVTTSNYNL